MDEHHFIEGALVFLLAVVVAVPLFERLKLGAVLAYLVAGAVLGPNGFGLMRTGDEGFAIAELGVVLLLFLIGLELSYARLWLMRRAVFGLGALQVLTTTLALSAVAVASGLDWRAALVAGFALSMSSTAVGVQLLSDRRELGDAHGRATLAVLLFQDLVAIPAIALMPLLAGGEVAPGWGEIAASVGKVAGAIALVVVGSRLLLRPLFRIVANTSSVEAFTALTLLVVLGTAWLTSLAGVSMAFGAFLAGVLLADSEYRHEIEANIEPFKGLLLGLFFIAVGVSVDWWLVAHHWAAVLGGVVVLLAVKFALLFVLGRTAGHLDNPGALKLAALLSQGGEFAFLLLAIAARSDLVPAADRDRITAIVVISMALTPLVVLGIDRWLARRARGPKRPFDRIDPGEEAPRVIIAGFGRVGQIVARLLTAHRIPFTALEQSVDQVEQSRRFGSVIYYGDPTRPEMLRAARADGAEIFVLATDDPEANVRTARLVKRQYPHLKVYARARNRQHAFRLMDLQLDAVVRETLHSSLELGRHVLIGLGVPPEQAAERVERFRRHDERMLDAQHAVYDDEARLVQSAKEALAELEQLFEADLRDDALVASQRDAGREG